MKKLLYSFLILLAGVGLSACKSSDTTSSKEASGNETITAIATFYPMYEFTKEVLGDEGNVELLIPAGTEPHDYEPSAKDIAKINKSDILVYNSSELEKWVSDMKGNIDSEQTLVVEAAKNIELSEGEHSHDEEEEGHDHSIDPHVWTDPVLAIKEVETIRDDLSKKFPDKKAVFNKNAQEYIEKLRVLDQEFTAALSSASNKTFVTQHSAFGYLAKQYGLTQESVSGISPDQEPSASRLAELKQYVTEHNVKVIYFEENASSKVAETLANETGVKLEVLNPLESLTNKQIEDGENYLSVMRDNLKALKESIQ